MYKFFIFSILSLVFVSCGKPLIPVTKTYEIEVPLETQSELNFCLPTSVLMCAKYFAKEVGWYSEDFKNLDSPTQEKFIYDYLKKNSGLTFYPNSQDSAPTAISKFLYNYLNISNKEIAILDTSLWCEENFGALKLMVEQIKFEQKPVIAVINREDSSGNSDNSNQTHAVVIVGIQENVNTDEVTKIFYNDPWYGYRNKSKSSWQNVSCLKTFDYLTLYFSTYN